MKTKHNELYEAPITEVVEVKTEGVICQSLPGAEVENYGWNIVPDE